MNCCNKTSSEDKGKMDSDPGRGGLVGLVVWRYRGHRRTYLWLGTAGAIRTRSHTDQPPSLPDHVWSWVVHDEMQGQIGLGDNG